MFIKLRASNYAGLLLLFFAIPAVEAQQWSAFRGNDGNGHADAKNLPIEFGDNQNLTWKIQVPGQAWSSPVIAEDQIWLTTAIETTVMAGGSNRRRVDGGGRVGRASGLAGPAGIELHALCFELATGQLLHSIKLFDVDEPPPINDLNSYASPTPVIDGDFVYCSFGSMGTACLNRKSGATRWKHARYQIDHQMGPGSSPLIHEDLLVLTFDGTDQQFIVAVDKQTGEQAWRTPRSGELNAQADNRKAYSTPRVIRVRGRELLISPGADWVYAYDPQTGQEVWRVAFGKLGFSNAPQPLFDGSKLYVCTGFMRSELLAIDVHQTPPAIVWRYADQVPTMSTPLRIDDRIYLISDRSIMSCIDTATGEAIWQQRLRGNCSSSPILADGRIYVGTRGSELVVLEPADTFSVLARNKLDSRIMATPAVIRDSLIVRTEKSLYHFQQQ